MNAPNVPLGLPSLLEQLAYEWHLQVCPDHDFSDHAYTWAGDRIEPRRSYPVTPSPSHLASGFQYGLWLAMKAVEGVPCETTTHGDDWKPIPGPSVKARALAAIRALQGGSHA